MKRKVVLYLVFIISILILFSFKKKKSKELITYQKGFYSFVQNQTKTTGNIFELTISTKVTDITIDSVWFGATPVPCDVYETKTLHRVAQPLTKGEYLIKANKNLYENFYRNVDSTTAFKAFSAPFAFRGEVIIMYQYKGKRYYKSISKVEKRIQKQLR